jgi:hypothetical protein
MMMGFMAIEDMSPSSSMQCSIWETLGFDCVDDYAKEAGTIV